MRAAVDTSNPITSAIRGRWAVAAIFLVNGFVVGSWAPQIPVFLTRLGISEFTLGLLILLFGAGAVSAMVWAGHLIPKHGSKTVTRSLPSPAASAFCSLPSRPMSGPRR